MSGHEDWEAAAYLGSSTRKVFLAQHHLRCVREAIAAFRPGDFFVDSGPTDPFIDVDADGDGCVLQLFGAFEAFSCAAAWHFRLGGDRNRFSLGQLAKSPPPQVAGEIGLVAGSDEYRDLSDLRHRAAHRGVVSQKRRLPINFEPKVVSLYTDDGREVISLLDRLVTWGVAGMVDLHRLVRAQAWPNTSPEEVNLLL